MKTAMIQLKKTKIFLQVLSALSTGRTLPPQACRVQRSHSAVGRSFWVGGVNVCPERRAQR